MNAEKSFKHGEEGTHSACNTRVKNEGGKSLCCYCSPHKGCDNDQPSKITEDVVRKAAHGSNEEQRKLVGLPTPKAYQSKISEEKV